MEQDQPLVYPPCCPVCGSDEDVIFSDQDCDGDENGIYITNVWVCVECDEVFS